MDRREIFETLKRAYLMVFQNLGNLGKAKPWNFIDMGIRLETLYMMAQYIQELGEGKTITMNKEQISEIIKSVGTLSEELYENIKDNIVDFVARSFDKYVK
jgi:hypothetical protein